jgi:hypothetical protein
MQLEFEREGERRGGIAGRERKTKERETETERKQMKEEPIGVKRCNWVKQLSCS